MPQVVELPLGDGSTVLVEVADADAAGIDRVGRGAVVARQASETLKDALERLRPTVATVLGGIRDLPEPPDRVALQFGIKVNAAAGVVVAQAPVKPTSRSPWNGSEPRT